MIGAPKTLVNECMAVKCECVPLGATSVVRHPSVRMPSFIYITDSTPLVDLPGDKCGLTTWKGCGKHVDQVSATPVVSELTTNPKRVAHRSWPTSPRRSDARARATRSRGLGRMDADV